MTYVITEDWGPCQKCGTHSDRRFGFCYQCCIEAELENGMITQEEYQKELENLAKFRKSTLSTTSEEKEC